MKAILCAVLLSITATLASGALQCYECSYFQVEDQPELNQLFAQSGLANEDCKDNPESVSVTTCENEDDLCFKGEMEAEFSGFQTTIYARGCIERADLESGLRDGGCSSRIPESERVELAESGITGASGELCTCDGDQCNAGERVAKISASVFLALLVGKFLV